jgi:peptide/nickel transport system substrate-binding protein
MSLMRKLGMLVCAITVLLSGCGSGGASSRQAASDQGQSARSATPKRVTTAIRGEPKVLSNMISRAGAGRVYGVNEIEMMIHTGLSVADDQAEQQPVLAESVPSVENGLWKVMPDGRMETTWKIRQGAKWQDGTALTAEDLVFTAQVIRELPEFHEVAFGSIDAVTAPDPRTVVVTWTKPFIWAHTMFSGTRGVPQPKHLLEKSFLEDKASYTQLPFWTDTYVGAGAYKIRDFVRGSHMVITAFDDFVLGRPKIDEIEIKFLPDANSVAANILAGLIDVTLVGQGMLSIEQALQVRDQWRDGTLTPVLSGSVGMFPQFINPSPAVIAEPQFRPALLMAIDRQLMIDTLQAGLSQIAHTNFAPQNAEYKDIQSYLVRYDYDPRRAAQMIEELGYSKGPDGFYRDATGQRLNLELRSTPGREVNESVTLSTAEHWQRIGIGVDTVIMPLQRNQDREYRSTRPAFEVVGQPDDIIRLHSAEIPTAETRYIGDNRPRYANAELDGLIERYYVTIPRAERVQVLGQILNHVTDRVVMLSLFYEAGPIMASNRMQNITSVPPWNVYAWDVK